ncbi:MAG: glycosyltransferase family 2 protein [Candidatus Hydrogenedentes bacterium]|nr:glycosyltransferase family 2 protein [Candidatus Hydrogenedentota bacterium]
MSDIKKFKFSIIAPVYNEVEFLEKFLLEIQSELKELDLIESTEVIFVNDGSNDGSTEKIDILVNKNPGKVFGVHLARNFGAPSAITAGIFYSSGDAVIIMDSDGQDDPQAFEKFLNLWRKGYDVVYAIRKSRKEGWLFKVLAWLFYRILSASSQIPLPLDAGNYSLLDRKVVEAIKQCPERNRYLPGLRSWVGFKQIGVEVERRARYDKKNRVGFRGLWTLAMNAFFSFSYVPIFLFRIAGILSLLLCIGLILFALYHKFITGLAVTAWASQLITTSFFGGINLLGIGLLGEYIARIYDEVKQRPIFICARTSGFEDKNSSNHR